eukprot:6681767-Lingulodinium_polyedra.AAC.1
MRGMVATAMLGDAPPSEEFPMLRATRAGGVEGPLLLNSLLAYHFDPLIRVWEERGWGFSFD